MNSEERDRITGLLRAELAYTHKRMNEAVPQSLRESYLLGLADGLVLAASHLGITLRPDLVDNQYEG